MIRLQFGSLGGLIAVWAFSLAPAEATKPCPTLEMRSARSGPGNDVSCVAVSPDGKPLASASSD